MRHSGKAQDQERERERAYKYRVALLGSITRLGELLIKNGARVALAYYAYLSVRELAGETTAVNALIKVAANLSVSQYAAWLAAGLFGGGWYLERRSRKKFINKHISRIRQMEQEELPERSSSGLNEYGDDPEEREP